MAKNQEPLNLDGIIEETAKHFGLEKHDICTRDPSTAKKNALPRLIAIFIASKIEDSNQNLASEFCCSAGTISKNIDKASQMYRDYQTREDAEFIREARTIAKTSHITLEG